MYVCVVGMYILVHSYSIIVGSSVFSKMHFIIPVVMTVMTENLICSFSLRFQLKSYFGLDFKMIILHQIGEKI